MENKMKDVTFAKRHNELQNKFQYRLAHPTSNRGNATVIIPVAVHFPESSPNDRACLEAMAQTQIDILNSDYKGLNSDIGLWNTAKVSYPGINLGQFDIHFEIATQNHPDISGISDGNKLVTIGYRFLGASTNDDYDPKYAGYLNIVVRDVFDEETNDPILGVSPLGGNPSFGESVKVGLNYFSSGNDCGIVMPRSPFNKGRTLTHEIGHFFNLDHTFGDRESCSINSGDGIADTPKIATENYGCPAFGDINACVSPQKALTMNYMDYTDDACMFMFTQGQVNYATNYINAIASSFKQNTILNSTLFASNEFQLFPNPAKDNLTINFSSPQNNLTVTMSDLSGRRVLNKEINNRTNSLSINDLQLNSGVYILTIISEGKTLNEKIIVE
jgi:Pregnancy-associated plasma protein-A/Secretion system C-terminal sorting domain